MHPKKISIKDYTYDLPKDRIAVYPANPRDCSKLLIYKEGEIKEDIYRNMVEYLPDNSVLIFNNTRVIKSRILFRRKTGALIELFCLEPYCEFIDYAHFFAQRQSAVWKCFVGNASKWKEKYLTKSLKIGAFNIELRAELIKRISGAYVVKLEWTPGDFTLAEVIEASGLTPLPPYIKREVNTEDVRDYQTVYSKHEGSVAAPTAGLHFTENMMEDFTSHHIDCLFTTLHVGAGTFKPVSSDKMEGHLMHAEWMHIELGFLKKILEHIDNKIISVGTTATRTLESLYWMGNKIINCGELTIERLKVSQWEPYENHKQHSVKAAIKALILYLENKNMTELGIETEIIIAPGYTYKIIQGLITNFHQPQSTLLLLVAALLGENWKEIYKYALENNFRFLSYGDGSLLLK